MQKLAPYIVRPLLFLFALGVGAIVVSLTFSALGRIFPNDLFTQIIGVMLFDIAALVWFSSFIYNSRSAGQYVVTFFGFLLGLAGTISMVAIEVGISAGMFKAAEMTKPLVYVFIAAAASHLVLIYSHHASAPDVDAAISLGIEKAKITQEGMRQAEAHLMSNQSLLGQPIAKRLTEGILHDLDIPLSSQVIDLPYQPQEQPQENFFGQVSLKQTPKESPFNKIKLPVPSWSWPWANAGRRYPASVQSAELSSPAPAPQPSTAPAAPAEPAPIESENANV